MSSFVRQTRSPLGMTIAVILALVAVLLVGQDARAKPARGVSVSDRVQAQSDLCFVSGGTFESRDYYGSYTNGHQFQKNVTTCTGGKHPQTCTNTKGDTTCTSKLVRPLDGLFGGGAIAEDHVREVDTLPEPTAEAVVVDDGAVVDGSVEPVVVAEPTAEPTAELTGEVIAEDRSEDATESVAEPMIDDGSTDEVGGEMVVDRRHAIDGSAEQLDRQ